jgi:hypothetical protein
MVSIPTNDQETQEKKLTWPSPELLLMAVCVLLNNWACTEITSAYSRFNQAGGAANEKKLLKLDRNGLISLMPGDRVRNKGGADFEWQAAGRPDSRLFSRRPGKNG